MRFTSRPGRVRRLLVVAAILVLVIGAYTFIELGNILAREDPLARADAIFVFAGTLVERPLEAADLYREGQAPTIVITRATAEPAVHHLARRGITLPATLDLTRDVLLKLDVPASALIVPDRIHDNTSAEAETLRQLAVTHGWRRVIVVSSSYHLRRVSIACRRALSGTGVEVVLRRSRYDEATPDRWWSKRSDIRFLASEVPKLIAYGIGAGR